MQDAHNQYALPFWHVKYDMGLMLVAPQVRRELVGAAANLGVVGKGLKTGIQSITITARLVDAEALNGVIGNFGKVGLGKAAESILSHSWL